MSSDTQRIIRVGSRKSDLALIQTKHVISCLQDLHREAKYEIHSMTTIGDRVLNISLPKIGEKSLFTQDLEKALRDGGVDFVVHSLKDLPTALPAGMAIGAILERDDTRDALVLNEKYRGNTLATLPKGSVIGTSSLRRTAQLSRSYPHLKVCDIRGNLKTRLAKLDDEKLNFSGIILAQAGLVRMGWQSRISQVLEPSEMLYAVGQGALAVECRSNDDFILDMLASLCHLQTECKILAERSFLKTLGGGCSAPVGVCTKLKRKRNSKDFQLDIKGGVWSLDGKVEIKDDLGCPLDLGDISEKDHENNDVSPAKRTKIDMDDVVETPPPPPPPQKCPIDHKRKSPDIIDDSRPSSSSFTGGDKIDLKKLINIHGELFKKCPYSLEIGKSLNETDEINANEIENCETTSHPFAIGQEVMGECPKFDVKQKDEMHKKLHPDQLKCPISQIEMDENSEKCPYLVKLLDYKDNLGRTIIKPTIIDNADQLFCGLHSHKHVAKEIFRDCEQLGINLANNLIKKGALKIMKCAQDEIHSKIPKK